MRNTFHIRKQTEKIINKMHGSIMKASKEGKSVRRMRKIVRKETKHLQRTVRSYYITALKGGE